MMTKPLEHKTEMTFLFKVNEIVEVFGPSPAKWRKAIIMKLEPYQGRPGYYVRYPDATEMWHCHGGWQPEQCVRKINQT